MIDTDKYEGHTPAPWDVREAGINRIMVYTDDEDFAYEEVNRNLVADAPLLLAEVKRLSALADALFNLIPSHLSTEATDVWNEHMGDEEE
jgi:hypothetical protein